MSKEGESEVSILQNFLPDLILAVENFQKKISSSRKKIIQCITVRLQKIH